MVALGRWTRFSWINIVHGLVTIVCPDNLLHQPMPHDILLIKVDKSNAFNVLKDVLHLNES